MRRNFVVLNSSPTQSYGLSTILETARPPTFFIGANGATKNQASQSQSGSNMQGNGTATYLPLQLKMPTEQLNKPRKISDVVREMLNQRYAEKLLDEFNLNQLTKLQNFLSDKISSTSNNKEKLALGRLLEKVEACINNFTATFKSTLKC